MFHHVIESAKIGLRKPDPRIYHMMVDALQVDPARCVYLDDLGVNLKPARDMGMKTIKVVDPPRPPTNSRATSASPCGERAAFRSLSFPRKRESSSPTFRTSMRLSAGSGYIGELRRAGTGCRFRGHDRLVASQNS